MLVIGEEVVLVVVNALTDPVPDAARPIAVFEFVQLNTEPVTSAVRAIAVTLVPVQ